MKILIIRTDIDELASSRSISGIDSAISLELYHKYRALNISANHSWKKYTFIDEMNKYIGTFKTMSELIAKNPFLGNVLILTHEQWLDAKY